MADSTLWHDLAAAFEELPDTLSIDWQYTSGRPGTYTYTLGGAPRHTELRFKRLAQRAGAAFSQDAKLDAQMVWLEQLRLHEKTPGSRSATIPEVMEDGTEVYHQLGTIANAAEASASLCIELELEQIETVRLTNAERARRAMSGDNAPPPPVAPVPPTQARKRGPKPDHKTNAQVAEVIAGLPGGRDWKSQWEEACEALDKADIPSPSKWRKGDKSCRCWSDQISRELVVKAIDYRLKMAKQPKLPPPQTLS